MTKNDIAKHVFARHPQLKEVHITSDGQAFITKHQARGHATRLKDQTIETLDKPEKVESIKVAGFAGKKKVETPAAPVEEVTPPAPVKEETPAPPVKEETPAAPAKEETPAAPAKEETTEPPVDPEKDEKIAQADLLLVGNVAKVSGKIETVATVEELDLLAVREIEGLNRKGIAQAIDARRAELTK